MKYFHFFARQNLLQRQDGKEPSSCHEQEESSGRYEFDTNRIMLIPLIMCVKVTIMTMGLMEMTKIQEEEINDDNNYANDDKIDIKMQEKEINDAKARQNQNRSKVVDMAALKI